MQILFTYWFICSAGYILGQLFSKSKPILINYKKKKKGIILKLNFFLEFSYEWQNFVKIDVYHD